MTTQHTIPQFTLDAMLAELTAQGYYVSFTREPEGYVASVSRAAEGDRDDYQHDAIGDTLAGALAGALPEAVAEALTALPAPGLADDVRTLSADMTDVFGRLNALEDRHDKFDHVESELVNVMVCLLEAQNPELRELRQESARRRAQAGKQAAGAASQN
jgi:hypothetical protein